MCAWVPRHSLCYKVPHLKGISSKTLKFDLLIQSKWIIRPGTQLNKGLYMNDLSIFLFYPLFSHSKY